MLTADKHVLPLEQQPEKGLFLLTVKWWKFLTTDHNEVIQHLQMFYKF